MGSCEVFKMRIDECDDGSVLIEVFKYDKPVGIRRLT